MATQTLKNSLGVILATIETKSDGTQVIRNNLGLMLGTYDPKSNVTRDHLGQMIGTGNLLATLI